jgi:hypothetical protein
MLYIMGTGSTVFSVGTIDMICSSKNDSMAAQHRSIPKSALLVRTDTSCVDMNILRGWLQRCDNNHGDHCQVPAAVERVPSDRPMWLIDVLRDCLVLSQPTDRYLALSYVWGPLNMFQALKSNIEELQKEKALKNDLFPIPRVVKDAFGLVILLNERYLWVDCLCIVQDDEETKMVQINNMASIYANSYATIVVADGKDANHGLRGIKGVSQSRKVVRKSVDLDDNFKLLQIHHSRLKSSVWWSRGWTLQEFVFSQRAIIFHDDIVSWECHCAVWDEDMEAGQALDKSSEMNSESASCQERYSNQARGLQFSPWPNLDQYMLLVCAYNSRQLTFAGDVLAAFKGVTNVLSRTFEGGFLCGLPEMFFDIALLWQPQRQLNRRAGLPSWSWVGWEGKIDQDSWRCGYDYVKSEGIMSDRQTSWKVFSILEWHTKSTMDEDGRTIMNSSRKYRDKYLYSDEDNLPSGWSRHCENQYRSSRTYRHDSDEKTQFSYPIPILDQTEKPENFPTTLLLCCRTRRAWFRIGPPIIRNPHTHHECSSVALKDPAGTWAGVLRLNKSSSSLFTFFLDSDAEGQPCELIAISRGVASNGKDESYFLDEWTAPERPTGFTRYQSSYEFYNVLWIE